MKILLAIDTSPIASETIATVQRMLEPTGGSVVVLCVVGDNEPGVIPSPVLLASVAQDLTVLEDDLVGMHQATAARAAQTLRDAGLEATSEIAFGDPRHVLPAMARSHAVDLIVVGCHGHSAGRRFLMGSVASYLVTHAPCNVLVVPHVHERATEAAV